MVNGILRSASSVLLGIGVFLLSGFQAAHSLEIRVVNRASGLPSDRIRALAVEDGEVWIGTADRGVVRWNPARGAVSDFSGEPGFTSKEVHSIALFREKVYVGTGKELMAYDGRKWGRITKAQNVTLRNVVLAVSPDGTELWAGAMTLSGGTAKFDGTSWKFMGGEGRGLFNDIASFAFGGEGTWMGSVSGTVFLHKGATVDYFREGISGSVFALAEAAGKLHAGTSEGLFRLEGVAWERAPFPQEWGKVRVFSMAVRDDALYLGTPAGLVRVRAGRTERLTAKDGLPADQVAVVAVMDDSVLAGTSNGLAVVRGW